MRAVPVPRANAEMDYFGIEAATFAARDRQSRAFALIELLVVITMIVVLLGLLFPAFQGVQNQAKKTQAKNDLTQIVTAVNAYYTEYGKYPLVNADSIYGRSGAPSDTLFDELRGLSSATQNPRQIVFISPADSKDASNPRAGIVTQDVTVNGVAIKKGEFVDPWGNSYNIKIDGDYDNVVTNPYGGSGGAGSDSIRQGVIAWSFGKDGVLGDKRKNDGKFSGSDDVISWQ